MMTLETTQNPSSKLLRVLAKFTTVVIVWVALLIIFGGKQAHATITPNPSPGPVPGWVYNDLINADTYPETPAFEQWISPAGNPAGTSVDVSYGQTSVNLDYHFAGIIGWEPQQASGTQTRLASANAGGAGTVTGIGGQVFVYPWFFNNNVGTYGHQSTGFTFTPNTPFTSDVDYTIVVFIQPINSFYNGTFTCVGTGFDAAGGWNFGRCPPIPVLFTVSFRIANPAAPVASISCDASGNPTGATLSWSGNAGAMIFFNGFVAEIDDNNNWGDGFYNKAVPAVGSGNFSTPVPAGFNGVAPKSGPLTLVKGQTYYARIFNNRYSNTTSFVYDCTGPPPPPPPPVFSPYLRVYGGDVLAGSGFENNCAVNNNAGISAYNQDSGTYNGAGAQFGAQAANDIFQFASAALRSPPNDLSFSNTAGNPTYGGDFRGAVCIPNYYGTLPSNASPIGANVNVHALGNGTFYHSGDMTIVNDGIGINDNTRTIVYVDGDVTIRNDIKYRNSTWKAGEVPTFYLIVRGNVYIDRRVDWLEGAYLVQPNNVTTPTNGNIYTCSDGDHPVTVNTSYYDLCNNNLTVYGAFVANRVIFGRTNGTLANAKQDHSADANIAETFYYSPELWMQPGPLNNGEVDYRYDSITGLPPVL